MTADEIFVKSLPPIISGCLVGGLLLGQLGVYIGGPAFIFVAGSSIGRGRSQPVGWKHKCLATLYGLVALFGIGVSSYYSIQSLRKGAYLLSFIYSIVPYYPAIFGFAVYAFFERRQYAVLKSTDYAAIFGAILMPLVLIPSYFMLKKQVMQ